ncbi:MAG TPA: hypothetical protein ENI92_00720 [Bacteroidetes bacterium]|nr:hypothetical protein [Bacteroidota bacterium]
MDTTRGKLKGLCMTCNHAGTCSYLARADGPIWHCEEFDDSGPAGNESANPVPPALEADPQPAGTNEGPLGICSNCAHLADCTFPKPPGGVWYCEEYE